jgi:hypothetical protein
MGVLYGLEPEFFINDMDFLVRQFSPIHVSLSLEVMYLTMASLITCSMRYKMENNTASARIAHLFLISGCFLVMIIIPWFVRDTYDIPVILRTAIILQQIRVSMKFISFLSVNESRLSKRNRLKIDSIKDHEQKLPTIMTMMYFMFAPTLIYQHDYPRSPIPTDWFKVAHHLLEWAFIFFPGLLMTRLMMPIWQTLGRDVVTAEVLIKWFLGSAAIGAMLIAIMGYFFLHVWLNMWSEILRFGDRQFYYNWWSCGSMIEFMRTWNFMVKSWLLEYIHRPCRRSTGSRIAAVLVTMLVSGFTHDYVYSYILGFKYAAISLLMLIQVPIMILDLSKEGKRTQDMKSSEGGRSISAKFASLLLYNALFGMHCSAEYWSRVNCPHLVEHDGHGFQFISASCIQFDFSNATWNHKFA